MRKKLTRTGNSLALVLDRELLEVMGIDASTPLEVSTDGEVIVISPVRAARRTERLRKVMERANDRYAGTFKRLASESRLVEPHGIPDAGLSRVEQLAEGAASPVRAHRRLESWQRLVSGRSEGASGVGS